MTIVFKDRQGKQGQQSKVCKTLKEMQQFKNEVSKAGNRIISAK